MSGVRRRRVFRDIHIVSLGSSRSPGSRGRGRVMTLEWPPGDRPSQVLAEVRRSSCSLSMFGSRQLKNPPVEELPGESAAPLVPASKGAQVGSSPGPGREQVSSAQCAVRTGLRPGARRGVVARKRIAIPLARGVLALSGSGSARVYRSRRVFYACVRVANKLRRVAWPEGRRPLRATI